MSSVAPFLVFFIGAALVVGTSGILRSLVMLAIPVVGAVNLYMLPADASHVVPLLG